MWHELKNLQTNLQALEISPIEIYLENNRKK